MVTVVYGGTGRPTEAHLGGVGRGVEHSFSGRAEPHLIKDSKGCTNLRRCQSRQIQWLRARPRITQSAQWVSQVALVLVAPCPMGCTRGAGGLPGGSAKWLALQLRDVAPSARHLLQHVVGRQCSCCGPVVACVTRCGCHSVTTALPRMFFQELVTSCAGPSDTLHWLVKRDFKLAS